VAQHVTLRLTFQDHHEDVAAEFADDEYHVLERFVEETDRLAETRLVQSGSSIGYSMKMDSNGVTTEASMPPEDDVLAFLYRLRPFVLKDEQTAFFRVCKILDRRLRHPSIQPLIEAHRDLFSGKQFQSLMKISITSEAGKDIVLNSEATLEKWLNAYEYHRDADKRQHLEQLHWMLPVESSRPMFVSMMIDKARAIAKVAQIIRSILASPTVGFKGR
jgi:hypothetical protein